MAKLWLWTLLIPTLLLVGCGGGSQEDENGGLSGVVRVDGSSTIFRFLSS